MTLDERLDNWSRWCWFRFGRTEQCDSIEGNYRSPQCWWPQNPRPKEVKIHDAWDVELAAATLSSRHHLVLKLRHVRKFDDQKIARDLRRHTGERTRPSDVMAVYGMACSLLAQALDTPVKERREQTVSYARQLLAA